MSHSKNCIWKLMQAISWHQIIPLQFVLLNLEVPKGREKSQKLEYLEKEKNLLDEIKNIFHNFKRAIIWWRNKNLIAESKKVADTSFKSIFSQNYFWKWVPQQDYAEIIPNCSQILVKVRAIVFVLKGLTIQI